MFSSYHTIHFNPHWNLSSRTKQALLSGSSFFDFSSAFNTAQCVQYHPVFTRMQVDPSTTFWIIGLSDRQTTVRVSEQVVSNTVAPQGSSSHCTPQIFNTTPVTSRNSRDASAAVGWHWWRGKGVQRTCGLLCFMEWRKTMVVGFRKTRTTLCCVSILGEEVEVVERYKYSYFLFQVFTPHSHWNTSWRNLQKQCYFRQLAS